MRGLSALGRHVLRNLVAYVALFVLLGGTAFAAGTLLPRNSVGSPQVVDRSLASKDVKPGQAPRGAAGLRGTRGPAGQVGATGPQGLGAKAPAASAGTTPTPPASPTETFQTASITVPANGKLLLVARLDKLFVACVVDCTYAVGLYLDGQPVSGSGFAVPCSGMFICSGSAENVSLSAIAAVPAGPHQVTLAGANTAGPSAGGPPGTGASQVAAIVLG